LPRVFTVFYVFLTPPPPPPPPLVNLRVQGADPIVALARIAFIII
jgi:hypothetical protein